TKTITISQAEGGTDSATVVVIINDTVDSAYVQARQTAGTDSAATIALIEATVDSAYVQLREAATAGGGLDSALTIQLIDSAYIQAREDNSSNLITGSYTQTNFRYTADSGQTVITGADANGLTLDYNIGNIDVFLNGILLVDSADYTQTNASTVTITSALDSGDEVSIINRKGTLVT
ncbi:MAG: hypothetical protein VW270_25890, partial [Candidatus Poseidoniales archaeon]